jgi:hypothetical protein
VPRGGAPRGLARERGICQNLSQPD